MEATISFAGDADAESASYLDELATSLNENDVATELIKSPIEAGRKDGGLTIAIGIATLVGSGVATVLSVLTFWQKSRPKYKVTVIRGSVKIEIENLSAGQLDSAVDKINTAIEPPKTMILITSNKHAK